MDSRGRRQPVHGAWPRHPCRGHPANPPRPASDNFRVRPPRKRKKRKAEAKAKAGWLAAFCRAEPTLGCSSIRYRIVDSDADSSTHDVDLPCRPRSTPTSSRELSEAGRCGLAGPLAPWMAPSSPMDGFTACPANPHRPAIPRIARCCCCFGFGCCLCGCRVQPGRTAPQGQAGGAATHACCTSASDARSSSRHCGSNCAWWALVLHCVGSVRTAAAYHCTASCFCPIRHSASA